MKSITIDFTHEDVPDYLRDLSEEGKKDFLSRANEIWNNEAFHKVYEYLVNKQGNFTLKQAINDTEIYVGRFNINGMNLLNGEFERCHALFDEMVKPAEEFDPHEVI